MILKASALVRCRKSRSSFAIFPRSPSFILYPYSMYRRKRNIPTVAGGARDHAAHADPRPTLPSLILHPLSFILIRCTFAAAPPSPCWCPGRAGSRREWCGRRCRRPDAARSRPCRCPTRPQLIAVGVPGVHGAGALVRRHLKIPHGDPDGVDVGARGDEVRQPLDPLVAEERVAVRIVGAPRARRPGAEAGVDLEQRPGRSSWMMSGSDRSTVASISARQLGDAVSEVSPPANERKGLPKRVAYLPLMSIDKG